MSNGDRGDGSSGARVVHVKRIFQDDDPESGAWVDVERIDELHLIVAGTQRVHYIFNWDVLESEGYDGPKKTIVDPNDENNTIDIPVREVVHVVGPKGKVAHQFLNDANNLSRETHSRRIYNHEIKKAYLVDGKPPTDPQDYLNSLGDQDKDQFVDVEIIDAYITNGFDKDDVYGHSQILANGVPKDSKARTQRKVWQGITDDPFMNEPLLESDEKGGDPGFIFLRNPDAGPTIDPPWRLDPLQNIVNVSWGAGGIFVAAYRAFGTNTSSKVLTNKIKSKDKGNGWEETFSTANSVAGFVAGQFPGCGVYASVGADKEQGKKGTPIFVFVGASIPDDGPRPAMILTSSNGKDWTSTPRGSTIGSEFYLVTWNDERKAFYAGMSDVTDTGVATVDFSVVLQSTDGKSWNEISRTTFDILPPPIAQYCSDKILDKNGNRVPTSVFGYDEKKDILIAPDPINITFGISYMEGEVHHGTSGFKIKRGPDNPNPGEKTIGLPSGMERVWAVALAGGIWQAAGEAGAFPAHGVIATSTDDGETWEVTHTDVPGSAFMAVAGGPTTDQAATSTG